MLHKMFKLDVNKEREESLKMAAASKQRCVRAALLPPAARGRHPRQR